jgi:hypothetical protein
LTPIEAYVDRPAPTTTLVFVASAIDRSRRLSKRLLDKATCVELEGLAGDNAAEKREARREVTEQIQRESSRPAGRSIRATASRGPRRRRYLKLRGDVSGCCSIRKGARRLRATTSMKW